MRAGAIAVLATTVVVTGCTSGSPAPAPTSVISTAPSPPTTSSLPTATSPAPAAYPDWPTYHGSPDRSGVSTTMPAASGRPRLAKKVALDAAVYAAPIVAQGIVVAATENDSVYGLNPAGGIRWHRSLGTPARSGDLPCGNIDPSGITGTPVYSSATGAVYVVTEHAGPVRHELAALDIRTGAVRWTRSVDLPGAEPNAMQARGALAIAGNRVWVTFGGRAGDCGAYKGRLIGVPLSGSGAAVSYTVPTSREAGLWTPPGPSVDADGHLFAAVGNGASGAGDPYDHSDSVLEFDANARLIDSFSPTSWASDNEGDLDLGSQGPALVGNLVFQAGKSGIAYVLRRGALGGIGGQASSLNLPCHSFGGTAVQAGVVYAPCTEGLRAVRIGSTGRMTLVWKAAGTITGSPVIGGGRIWALDTDGGVLHALDPSTGSSLGAVSVGAVTRFATPAIFGRTMYVGTRAGLSVVTT